MNKKPYLSHTDRIVVWDFLVNLEGHLSYQKSYKQPIFENEIDLIFEKLQQMEDTLSFCVRDNISFSLHHVEVLHTKFEPTGIAKLCQSSSSK